MCELHQLRLNKSHSKHPQLPQNFTSVSPNLCDVCYDIVNDLTRFGFLSNQFDNYHFHGYRLSKSPSKLYSSIDAQLLWRKYCSCRHPTDFVLESVDKAVANSTQNLPSLGKANQNGVKFTESPYSRNSKLRDVSFSSGFYHDNNENFEEHDNRSFMSRAKTWMTYSTYNPSKEMDNSEDITWNDPLKKWISRTPTNISYMSIVNTAGLQARPFGTDFSNEYDMKRKRLEENASRLNTSLLSNFATMPKHAVAQLEKVTKKRKQTPVLLPIANDTDLSDAWKSNRKQNISPKQTVEIKSTSRVRFEESPMVTIIPVEDTEISANIEEDIVFVPDSDSAIDYDEVISETSFVKSEELSIEKSEEEEKVIDSVSVVTDTLEADITLNETTEESKQEIENEQINIEQKEEETESKTDLEGKESSGYQKIWQPMILQEISETAKVKKPPRPIEKKVRAMNLFEKPVAAQPVKKPDFNISELDDWMTGDFSETKVEPLKYVIPLPEPEPIVVVEERPKTPEEEIILESELVHELPLLRKPKILKKRWGAGSKDKSYADFLERQRRAENLKKMAQNGMGKGKTGFMSGQDGSPSFDDYGFLAKYCILKRDWIEQFKTTFISIDMDEEKGWLNREETVIGLRSVNPNLTDPDLFYMDRVMEMCGYGMRQGADFKLFAVLCALSQKITALDSWIRNLNETVDFKMLDMKLFVCKQLWECNVNEETKCLSLDQLVLELSAGGVGNKHIKEVRQRLGYLKSLDILDFLTYVPLFIMLHCSITDNPLDDVRDK